MKRLPLLSLVLAAAAASWLPTTAHAATGMYCWSKFNYRVQSGDQTGQSILIGQAYSNNSTIYSCSGLGNYTVPQLYSLGYKVTQEGVVIPPVVVPISTTVVTAYFKILIEKP